jgi:hypothetical protein
LPGVTIHQREAQRRAAAIDDEYEAHVRCQTAALSLTRISHQDTRNGI